MGKTSRTKIIFTSGLDDPTICSHLCLLALEICFDLESSSFEETENSFLRNDTKIQQSSCFRLVLATRISIVRDFQAAQTVRQCIYLSGNFMCSHDIRKARVVLVASDTTMPPSISSTALHGKWSIKRVIDEYYWPFGEP